MTTKIDIDTGTFVRFLVVMTSFVGVAFLAWKLWPSLLLILVSFFLALALNGPVSAISRRLPGKSRVGATAISYLIVLSVLIVGLAIAIPPLIEQTSKLASSLPSSIQSLSQKGGPVSNFIEQNNLQPYVDHAVASIQSQADDWARQTGERVLDGVSSVLNALIIVITTLVLTFLMLVEGPSWMQRIWSMYRDERLLHRHQKLAKKMYLVVRGFVNGQALVAVIGSLCALVILLILSSFFNVPISVIIPIVGVIFITGLIPMIGATLGAITASLVLVFNDPMAALVFIIYFIIYQQIENNSISPAIQSRKVAISALTVLIAVIIGISLLGIIGGIIAVPVAGCIRLLIHDYFEHRKTEHHKIA